MEDRPNIPTQQDELLEGLVRENHAQRQQIEALREQLEAQRAELDEARQTLEAIRQGQVDALVIQTATGQRVFTLEGADRSYRALIEQMGEGAAMLAADGTIHYANRALADLLKLPLERLLGSNIEQAIAPAHRPALAALLGQGLDRDWAEPAREEVEFETADGDVILAQVMVAPLVEGDAEAAVSMVVIDLTQRQRAEKVQASEERYRLLFDHNPDGVFAVDGGGRFIVANPASAAISGYSLPELLRMTFMELCAPDQLAKTVGAFQGVLRDPRYMQFETALIRKDGRRVELWVAGEPMVAGGRMVAMYCTVKDITDRKAADAELKRARNMLAEAQRIAHLGSFEYDAATHTTVWSEEEFRIYGLDPAGPAPAYDDMLARCIHPDDAALLHETFARAMQSGGIYELEHRIVRPDGSVRWVYDRAQPYFDEQGSVLRYVGATLDITDRKRAAAALAAAHHQLQSIIDNTPAIVYACDTEHRFVMANAAIARLLDTTPQQLLGKRRCEVMPRQDADAHEANERRVIQTGQAIEIEEHSELPGRSITWLTAKFPLRDQRGAIYAVAGISSDISDRKRAEEALAAARDTAEEASKAKDHFLAVLSHELRTPLNPVLMAASELGDDGSLGQEQREAVAVIRRNVELQSRLIDDLLDVTRVAQGKIHLNCAVVDLRQVIRHAAQTCDADARSKAQHLVVDVGDEPLPVDGDPARLEQVIWNLLRNAIKFTPQRGRIAVRARIGAGDGAAAPRVAIVEVSDSGIGIDPDVLSRVFDAFEQAAEGRLFGGLGLGLSIVRALVELHGGSVAARSDGRDRGSTFTVTLPLTAGAPGPVAPALRSPAQAARSLRILLVEDHQDSANVLARLLVKMGHTVAIAESVAAGLRTARAQGFDLLISDIGLPDGNGLDLMRQLRTERSLPGIVLSGHGMEQDVQQSREAGFAVHLTKPVTLSRLRSAIQAITVGGPEEQGAE